MALNPKQQRFVAAYLTHGNAARAYREAGYAAKGDRQSAHQLLTNPDIRKAIDAGREAALQAAGAEAVAVIRQLVAVGTADIKDVLDPETGLLHRNLAELPDEVRAAIASVEIEEDLALYDNRAPELRPRKVKLKFWDKNKALELLGKHLGLYTEKVELSGKMTLEQMIEAATKTEGK